MNSETQGRVEADPTPDFSICGQFLDDFSMPMSALGTELHDETRKALQIAITAPGKNVGVCSWESGAKDYERFRRGQAAVVNAWHRDVHPELPGKFRVKSIQRVRRDVPQVERIVYVTYVATA